MTKSRSLSDYTNELAIPGANLEDGAIDTDKLANESVTQAKLDPNVTLPIPDESVDNDKISPTAAIDATKLSFSGFNSTVRSVQDKLTDYTNVKDFGATGDGVTDDTDAIKAAVARIYAGDSTILYFPPGEYVISDTLATGVGFGIVGSGVNETVLLVQNFGSDKYVFEFNGAPGYNPIRDFRVIGTVNYFGPGFLYNANGFTTVIHNLRIQQLSKGIVLGFGYACWLNELRILYCAVPISIDVGNGTVISNVYIQRYTENGILMQRSASPRLTNIICEYGFYPNKSGIVLQSCDSAVLENYYTEGGQSNPLTITYRNQKPSNNTTVRNLWLGANGPSQIKLSGSQGTTIENVTLIRLGAPELITFAGGVGTQGPVYVSNVCQIDQPNENNSRNQPLTIPLIPLSNDNTKIVVVKPFPKSGNGTSEDGNNLANHTIKDSNGIRPVLYNKPRDFRSNDVSGLTCSGPGDTFGANSTGISVYSDDYGSFKLVVIGTIVSSTGAVTYSRFKVTNTTHGDAVETGVIPTGASGSEYQLEIYANVAPGRNDIALAISRDQGGGGTNTFTVSDYSIS